MSRIGKQIINIPGKVEIKLEGNLLKVKGPLGELSREFLPDIEILINENQITLKPKSETQFLKALWGTYAAHIKNMITGVTAGFKKNLIIEGVGYKSELQGNTLNFALGFSHPVKLEIPAGLKVTVEKGNIGITGCDSELVGAFAAKLRDLKKPEPYKGKGIRYADEVIIRKQGKKAVSTA